MRERALPCAGPLKARWTEAAPVGHGDEMVRLVSVVGVLGVCAAAAVSRGAADAPAASIRTERGCTDSGEPARFAVGETLRGTLRVDAAGAEQVPIRIVEQALGGAEAVLFSASVAANRDLPFATTVSGPPGEHVLALEAEWNSRSIRAQCGYVVQKPGGGSTPTAGVSPVPTPTPAESPTLTPTATQAASSVEIVSLDVVQAVQDAAASVPLVAGKRTFARVLARTRGEALDATAHLLVRSEAGAWRLVPLLPGNALRLRTEPSYGQLADGFLFELPTAATLGRAEIQAVVEVREDGGTVRSAMTRNLRFEQLGRPEVVLYEALMPSAGEWRGLREEDVRAVVHWLDAAWPTTRVRFRRRRLPLPGDHRACEDINTMLAFGRGLDHAWGELSREDRRADRYLALVPDFDGFVRGCSPLGGATAVAPAGAPARLFPTDPDDSYADWYAAHELTHAYGLDHGDTMTGAPYAREDGRIGSPGNPEGLMAFDARRMRLVSAQRPELTSALPAPWISDLTWEVLLDLFRSGAPLAAELIPNVPGAGALWVVAVAFALPEGDWHVRALPLAFVPAAAPGELVSTEEWTAVLRGSTGEMMARSALAARPLLYGPVPEGADESRPDAVLLTGALPASTTATVLEIEHGGEVVLTRSAGPASPTVRFLEPPSGAVLSEGAVRVRWEGSDPDGEVLWYWLQFSRDDGAHWRWIAGPMTETEIPVDALDLPGGGPGILRLWASDGLHASTSDLAVTVPDRAPVLEWIAPAPGEVVLSAATVHLAAWAEDYDDGWLRDDAVRWESNRAGLLGLGREVTVTGLAPGPHLVRVSVRDGGGHEVERRAQLIVVEEPGELPAPAPDLSLDPWFVVLDTGRGVKRAVVDVAGIGGTGAIAWTASTDVPWLRILPPGGTTRSSLHAELRNPLPDRGRHHGRVVLTSVDAPGRAWIAGVEAFIRPLVCDGDCDANGRITIDELIGAVQIALGEVERRQCAAADLNRDGEVSVSELIRMVRAALDGCNRAS